MKPPKTENEESWLGSVAGASETDYQRMQEQVLNADKLTPRATLFDLRLMQLARAGLPTNFFTTGADDPLASHHYGQIRPPWAGTDDEASPLEEPLMKIKLDPERATMFPIKDLADSAVEARHTEFRNWIDSEVQQIGKIFKESKPEPFSEQARKLRGLSKRLRRLADEVDLHVPLWSYMTRSLADKFDSDAEHLNDLSDLPQFKKRHSEHPVTWRIRALMDEVHHETGHWHDAEISKMLQASGLAHMDPSGLRVLRARNKSQDSEQ